MAYRSLNDGTLTCTLSTKLDDAGDSMVRLIQQHMVVILRPMNEHIEHLFMKNENLSRALSATDEMVEKNRQRLGICETELAANDAKHSSLENEVKVLKSEVKELDVRRRLASCEAENRANRKARIEVDERLDRTILDIEAFQPLLDESHAAVHRVETKVWQTASLSERFDRDFETLRQESSTWNDRLLGLSRGVEQIHNAHENTRKCFVKLTSEVDGHQKQAKKDIAALGVSTKGLEATIAETASKFPPIEEIVKNLNQQLGEMNVQFDDIEKNLHQLEEENKQQDETDRKLESARAEEAKKQVSVLERMKEIETNFVKIKLILNKELEKNIPGAVRDLSLTVERHSSSINQQALALKNVEAGQTGWQERFRSVETRTGDSEAVQADLVKRTDLAHVHISELLSAYKTAETRIDSHHVELEKMEAYTSTTRHALGQTNAAVQHLHGDLGTAKGGLANTAMRLDLAHEYITGVSRGLQETHKLSLTGQDGMLSSKCGVDRTRPLPMIGVSGRPA